MAKKVLLGAGDLKMELKKKKRSQKNSRNDYSAEKRDLINFGYSVI